MPLIMMALLQSHMGVKYIKKNWNFHRVNKVNKYQFPLSKQPKILLYKTVS